MKTITESEALNKAAAYCTPCERCTHEVVAKLKAWGVTEEAQQRIIERLKSENFINEERYSRAFVNDKLRFNQWGRIKIQAALREKQIDRENINNAIAAIDDDTYIAIMKNTVGCVIYYIFAKECRYARQSNHNSCNKRCKLGFF